MTIYNLMSLPAKCESCLLHISVVMVEFDDDGYQFLVCAGCKP